ncbi:MAG: hypothetical protein WD595_04465 [Waddliaceae bacterium]
MNQDFNFKVDTGKDDSFKKSRAAPYPPDKDKFEKVLSKQQQAKDAEKGVKDPDKEDLSSKKTEKKSVEKEGKLAKADPSLFELQSESKISKGAIANEETADEPLTSLKSLSEEMYKDSLSALNKGIKEADFSKNGNGAQAAMPMIKNLETKGFAQTETGDQKPTVAMQEVPNIMPQAPTESVSSTTPQVSRASELQEIVDQIVSKIYTLTLKGQTDTTIELRHPPLLEGSNVVISSFKSAKGEFNIRFENLSTSAKQMLDSPLNQDGLKAALEQKGYVVHMITTTTQNESAEAFKGGGFAKNSEQQEKEQQKNQQQEEEEQG